MMLPITSFSLARFALIFLSFCGLARAGDLASAKPKNYEQTPEIRLVDEYDAWFLGGGYEGNMEKLRDGLRRYITADTILHEPVSLPWGGTMVGYDGWVRLCQIADPIFGALATRMKVSPPQYYQNGNVVLREVSLTIQPSKATEMPFFTWVIEKYTVENGRIQQIDEYWSDTASLLNEFVAAGVVPRPTN